MSLTRHFVSILDLKFDKMANVKRGGEYDNDHIEMNRNFGDELESEGDTQPGQASPGEQVKVVSGTVEAERDQRLIVEMRKYQKIRIVEMKSLCPVSLR